MGPERTLDVFGAQLEMPANAVLGGVAEDFEAPSPVGPAAVYAMTGTFPIADIQAAMGRALAEGSGAELDRSGRVVVGPDCSLPSCPNVFVVGDEDQSI